MQKNIIALFEKKNLNDPKLKRKVEIKNAFSLFETR